MPPTSEAPPSNEVPAVAGVAAKGWLGDTGSVLTTKAANVITNTTRVTTKAAEMATKASEPSSGMACSHCRWSDRQTQNDRRR